MSALGNSLVIWRWVLRQMALKVTSSISDSGKSGHRPIDSYKITPFTSLKVQRFMDSSLPRNPAIPSVICLDMLWYALICLYCSRKVKAGQDSGLTKKNPNDNPVENGAGVSGRCSGQTIRSLEIHTCPCECADHTGNIQVIWRQWPTFVYSATKFLNLLNRCFPAEMQRGTNAGKMGGNSCCCREFYKFSNQLADSHSF